MMKKRRRRRMHCRQAEDQFSQTTKNFFLTLEPIPSQDQLSAECDARKGTSAETFSRGASSMLGQRLFQIRRWKKKTREDMFNELIHASKSDKMELSTWRIALSENLHNDCEDRRACREHKCDTQDEMVRLMREQTDMLRHLVEVQERQLDARVPLQPMVNLLPLLPSSTFSSLKYPRMWGRKVRYPLHSIPREGARTRRHPFPHL
ncbi:uncharacterized protein LOC128835468 [Malaclemys terrapin pileata]|uniref:uncharacterized protein LOC128835468 n=1 Tax=Malaclemys terrapin pileata TaxID=2991368 RepID=UPI0023A8AB3B|nr:uncharacterized protein LOC128835468 [Malaclemys terrapin pileata]